MNNVMNNKTVGLTVLTVLVIGLTRSSLAYQGDYSKKGPNYSQERHQAMEKAFANNDYEAWKKLMEGRGRVVQVITKENFAEFAKAHKLGLEGKKAEADAIREKLGLRTSKSGPRGAGNGQGIGKGRQNK